MGRKPLTKQYFGPPQEEAVRIFLTATAWDEKNTVYNEYLRDPLIKMIESIIRRYRLYRPNMEFTDIHTDTLSFLVTKMEKFKPAKGKKPGDNPGEEYYDVEVTLEELAEYLFKDLDLPDLEKKQMRENVSEKFKRKGKTNKGPWNAR